MKTQMLLALALLCAALGTGCATRPQDVEAAYVSADAFAGLSAEQMREEQARLVSDLRRVSEMQHQTRAIDSAFILIGGLSADDGVARDVARAKGRLLALAEAAKRAGFDLPAINPDEVAASPSERPSL